MDLQRDLLENPNKYTEMLDQDLSIDPWIDGIDPGRFFEMKDAKNANLDYKYSFFNDGRNRKNWLDHWHLRSEYLNYKDWHEQIQKKALDTLKLTVSRLLIDFENNF